MPATPPQRPSALLAAALVGAALLGAPARADDLDERIAIASGGRLTVDLDLGIGLRPDRGVLVVVGHDAPELQVLTESTGWASWAVRFELERSGDEMRLVGRVEGATSWMFGGPHVAVHVRVPRPFTLDLRTTAGPIRLEGVRGAVRVRGEDGDVEVRETRGPLKLRTVRGRIDVEDAEGDLDLKTHEGDIEIARVTGAVRARTTVGDIDARGVAGPVSARTAEGEIELAGLRGSAEARTGRGTLRIAFQGDPSGALESAEGGIDVSFPPDGAADLDARGASLDVAGGIRFDGESEGGAAVGALGGGGAPLWLRAPRGRIRLHRREAATP